MFAAYGAFFESWSRVQSVDHEIGLADMRAAIAACRKRGIGLNVPLFTTVLAEAEAQAGELDAALATVDGAIAEIERDGQRWCEADAHRVRGEILLKHDPANAALAEEAFLTAIAIARQQKARSFELRAATSLARLRCDQGKRDAARDLLVPVYGGFTEGFDTLDLKEAKALLDELHA